MGQVAQGKPCTSDGQCTTGFCTDGVCCQTACKDTCWTCSAQDSVGTCIPVDVGSDPRNDCADDGPNSCGNDGACDGSGACRRYPAGMICRQPSCSGSTLTTASRCEAGVCKPTSGFPCDPYVCDSHAGNVCLKSCVTNADCGAGNVCNNGSCGKRPIGASCATADDCNSNLCQQGICCQTLCSGTCMSCAVPQSEGVCTPVPAGTDPLGQCADSGRTTCGTDGLCDGKGGCETYSKATICKDPTCPVGGSVGVGRLALRRRGDLCRWGGGLVQRVPVRPCGHLFEQLRVDRGLLARQCLQRDRLRKEGHRRVVHDGQRVRLGGVPAECLLRHGLQRHLHGLQSSGVDGALSAAAVRQRRAGRAVQRGRCQHLRQRRNLRWRRQVPPAVERYDVHSRRPARTRSKRRRVAATAPGCAQNGATQPCAPFQCGTNGMLPGHMRSSQRQPGLHDGEHLHRHQLRQEAARRGMRRRHRVRLDHLRAGRLLRHGLHGDLQVMHAHRQRRSVPQRSGRPGPARPVPDRPGLDLQARRHLRRRGACRNYQTGHPVRGRVVQRLDADLGANL